MTQPEYVFASSADRHEWERLSILQEEFDSGTCRRLRRLGLAPGWTCLEVGPGAGSVMNWLCEQVGGTGRVVAVDLDPRFVANTRHANLEVRRADISLSALEDRAFDLVHVRCVLMHVKQRAEVLEKLVGALKPGGWLLVEEPDFSTLRPADEKAPGADALAGVFQATIGLYDSLAIDTSLGRRLPCLLSGLGLAEVDTETELAVARGGSRRAKIWRMAVEHFGDRLAATGRVAMPEVQAFVRLMDRAETWFMDYALIASWGRRVEA